MEYNRNINVQIYYSTILNNGKTYIYVTLLDVIGKLSPKIENVITSMNNIVRTTLNQAGWKTLEKPEYSYKTDKYLFDFRSIKMYKNVIKNIRICYKDTDDMETMLDQLRQIIHNLETSDTKITLTQLDLNNYNSYGLHIHNNLDILLTSTINNLIFDNTLQENKVLYFTFYQYTDEYYILYGNIEYLKVILNSNRIDYKKVSFIDQNGIIEFVSIKVPTKDKLAETRSVITENDFMIANYDRVHIRILKYLGGMDKKVPKKFNIPQRITKTYKDQHIQVDFKRKREIMLLTLIIDSDTNSILYPLDRKVYLWNDNNRLITGNLEMNNTWRKRGVSREKGLIKYQYEISSFEASQHFSNFLFAFGINTNNNPFLKRESLIEIFSPLKQDTNDNYSQFDRVGYNSDGLVVQHDMGQNWVELLNMGFKFDPQYNWWYKFPANYLDTIELNKLDIYESRKSLRRYVKSIELNDIFVKNANTSIILSSDVDIIDSDIYDNLLRISSRETVCIYLETHYKDEGFSGIQMNYNDTVLSMWISYYDSSSDKFVTISVPWEIILDDTRIKNRILYILNYCTKICYNIKGLIVQLLKHNLDFEYDTFTDDVMLASWIYNPVFEEKKSDWGNREHFPCQNRYYYNLENIYNTFTNNYINLSNYTESTHNQIIYSVYPLILSPIIIPMIHKLGLYDAYTLEVQVNKISAKIENRGLNVNKEQLNKIRSCLDNNMLMNKQNITAMGRTIGYDVDTFLTIGEGDVKYNPGNFYVQFEENCIKSGIFEAPFIQPKTKKGSRVYIESFITKNPILNLPENQQHKDFLNLLLTILKYSYLYRIQLPSLISTIDENDEIHPCINTISKPGGRFDTTLPRFHWMPNPDKTIWGKFIRRSVQSRTGYKFITIDWSAQELLTIGLLSKDPDYIKSVNSGDQHVVTGIKLFSDQKIDVESVIIDEDRVLFKIHGSFDDGNSSTIYISNGVEFYKTEYKIMEEGFIEIRDKKVRMFFQNENVSDYVCISKKQRSIAKNLSFGLMYGMRESTFRQQLQNTKSEMVNLINLWWDNYKGVKKFIRGTYYSTFWNGYANTYFGKRCFFPQLMFYKERLYNEELTGGLMSESIISYVNSGTAADWLKKSLVMIDKEFIDGKIDGHIVHTMHDEIVIEVKNSDIEKARSIAIDIMENRAIPEFHSLGIKVKTTTDICDWWETCNETDTIDSNLISHISDEICSPTI